MEKGYLLKSFHPPAPINWWQQVATLLLNTHYLRSTSFSKSWIFSCYIATDLRFPEMARKYIARDTCIWFSKKAHRRGKKACQHYCFKQYLIWIESRSIPSALNPSTKTRLGQCTIRVGLKWIKLDYWGLISDVQGSLHDALIHPHEHRLMSLMSTMEFCHQLTFPFFFPICNNGKEKKPGQQACQIWINERRCSPSHILGSTVVVHM